MMQTNRKNIINIPSPELTELEYKLLHEAAKVRRNAQAPYSKFHVGAAVLTEKKTIYTGCNVERCTLTQTTHAEQNAIDTMIATEGSSKINTMAFIAAPAHLDIIIPSNIPPAQTPSQTGAPCGHCLQIIWENCYGDSSVKIITFLNNEIYISTIGVLLPIRFGPQDLDINY